MSSKVTRTRLAQSESEVDARARRAVKNFRRMLPTLNSYVRAISGDSKLRIEIVKSNGASTAHRIYFQPPISLGDERTHVYENCDQRDTDGVQTCEACKTTEFIYSVIYHELGHITKGTFATPTDNEVNQIFEAGKSVQMYPPVLTKYSGEFHQKWGQTKARSNERGDNNNYMGLASLITPYMGNLFNAIEDARVNEQIFAARQGVRRMYDAMMIDTALNGVPDIIHNEPNTHWRDLSSQMQIQLGVYFYLAGYSYRSWLQAEVCDELENPDLTAILDTFDYGWAGADSLKFTIKVMNQLNKQGFLVIEPPEEQEEDDENEDAEDQSDDGEESEDESGEESGSSSSSGGKNQPQQPSDVDQPVGGQGQDPQPEDSEEDSDDGGDSEPADSGDEGDSDNVDQPAGGDQDESEGSGEGTESHGSDPAPAGNDEQSEAPEADEAGSSDDSEPDPDDLTDEVDTGADRGEGGIKLLEPDDYERPMNDAADQKMCLGEMLGLEEKPDSAIDAGNDEVSQAIERAAMQEWYFETASMDIRGVSIRRHGDQYFDATRPLTADVTEPIMQRSLLRLRLALEENLKASMERNRKSGKINARVLGKRAPTGDDRLFQRKRIPSKRSYFVAIAVDCSGSLHGTNMRLAKQAVYAQAELLHRAGIPFSIFGHTCDYEDLIIFNVKEGEEPWNTKSKDALMCLDATSGNLDGHAMEYLRKQGDAAQATDVVLMYYSDGKMPASNFDEELEILQREIRTCERKRYTLLGVGIRTDSPREHGLETVLIEGSEDTEKVVKFMQSKLIHR